MATESSTHMEYLGEGYKVRIQHCEFLYSNGQICDEYLGVEYPSDYCNRHRNSI